MEVITFHFIIAAVLLGIGIAHQALAFLWLRFTITTFATVCQNPASAPIVAREFLLGLILHRKIPVTGSQDNTSRNRSIVSTGSKP